MSPMAAKEVWDLQPEEGETEAPGRAFLAFRGMSRPRSMTELAKQLDYAVDTIHGWSSEFCWRERVEAYDTHLDQLVQKETETAVQRMARKHLEVADVGLRVARKALLAQEKDLDKGIVPLSAQAAARLLDVCTRLERLTNGEVTDRIGGIPDLSKLSDEQLRQAEKLNRIVRGEDSA